MSRQDDLAAFAEEVLARLAPVAGMTFMGRLAVLERIEAAAAARGLRPEGSAPAPYPVTLSDEQVAALGNDREHDERQDRKAVGGAERTSDLAREEDEDKGLSGRAY